MLSWSKPPGRGSAVARAAAQTRNWLGCSAGTRERCSERSSGSGTERIIGAPLELLRLKGPAQERCPPVDSTLAQATSSEIVHWDGTAWSRIWSRSGELTAATASAPDSAWVVGFEGTAGFIMKWDGASWQELPTRLNHVPTTLWSRGRDDVWMGSSSLLGPGPSTPLLQHWDGTLGTASGLWAATRSPTGRVGAGIRSMYPFRLRPRSGEADPETSGSPPPPGSTTTTNRESGLRSSRAEGILAECARGSTSAPSRQPAECNQRNLDLFREGDRPVRLAVIARVRRARRRLDGLQRAGATGSMPESLR